jgi:hypothetical protein
MKLHFPKGKWKLLDIVHMIHSNDEAQMLPRGIFSDVAGDFDAVPHFLLMHKLKSYGIRGNLLFLLDSYLQGHNIKVRVDLQGSILGPLLFLIYINDLADIVENCLLYLYANDISLFLPVYYNDNTEASSE